jgi:hypothetical protein
LLSNGFNDFRAYYPTTLLLKCNLGTANCRGVKESWAVLTNTPLSLQTFQLYGQRFGGVEPRFKDYKSGTFDILRSKLRDAQALSNLLTIVEIAEILAIRLGLIVIETRQRSQIDWHSQRGLSLLQLGIRTIKSLRHQTRSLRASASQTLFKTRE